MRKVILVLGIFLFHSTFADTLKVYSDPEGNYIGRFEEKPFDDGALRLIIDHATGCEYLYVDGRSITPLIGHNYQGQYCPSENRYDQKTDGSTKAYRK